jgi:hypothetical protein
MSSMPKRPGSNTSTNTIALNLPLLSAIISVAGVSIAEWIMITNTTITPGWNIATITLFIWIATLIYSTYVLLNIGYGLWKSSGIKASVLCSSALLGSLLLGMLSTIFSLRLSTNEAFSLFSIVLSVLSLLGLALFIVQEQPKDEKEAKQKPGQSPPSVSTPQSNPLLPQEPTVKMGNPKMVARKEPLPPLFVNDSLHQIPLSTSSMRIFSVTKSNEPLVFSDDACVVSRQENLIALCDGTSNSAIPRPWATLLGLKWLTTPPPKRIDSHSLAQWLEEPRSKWREWVRTIWLTTVNQRNELTYDPIVTREGLADILQTGAASTFLGIYIDRQKKHWSAMAIGDTCLFYFKQIERNHLQIDLKWPIQHSGLFTDSPPLLSTRSDKSLDALLPYVQRINKEYRSGDRLWLATDALAQWIYMQLEQDLPDYQNLFFLEKPEDFSHLVNREREKGAMQEDDTTFVMITL